MPIKAVKGVKDILPETVAEWRAVELCARDIFARFCFKEIYLPIFEKSEVFIKGVGEQTDIVQKEMYSFIDTGGDSLTLRPEGTASCVRSYIEHSMYHPKGSITKLFYMGPMFRRERPQAGRFRQFYQIGAEYFGSPEPEADAELIHLLHIFISAVGVKGPLLSLNSLGCRACRPSFRKALVEFLNTRKDSLCDLCKERYEKNPLRVFDCKNENCGKVVEDAPSIDKFRCAECASHFAGVEENLNALAVPYSLEPRMVRGLDYYSRTVFEITAQGLGAQNAIAGGGRYDDLVKDSGGPEVPAIGFALGMERMMESIAVKQVTGSVSPDVYIVHIGDKPASEAFRLAGSLREKGFGVKIAYKPAGMKNQMGRAGKSGAKAALILGDDELAKGVVTIKDMVEGSQEECRLDSVEEALKKITAK